MDTGHLFLKGRAQMRIWNGKHKGLKRTLMILLALGILGGSIVFGGSAFVKYGMKQYIYEEAQMAEIPEADCILVLGAGLKADGTPNFMLKDRLDRALSLYRAGVSDRLLMSGDHGQKNYDEVTAMKKYALDAGVTPNRIFLDHAGFSTYESMYRADEIFEVKSAVVVTQRYHLYRALYSARQRGIEAYGMPAEDVVYGGQWVRDFRENFARTKDVVYNLFQQKPTYLGEKISIHGDASATDD